MSLLLTLPPLRTRLGAADGIDWRVAHISILRCGILPSGCGASWYRTVVRHANILRSHVSKSRHGAPGDAEGGMRSISGRESVTEGA